jgi:hypothetical protein
VDENFQALFGCLFYAGGGALFLALILWPRWRRRQLLHAPDLDDLAQRLGGEVARDPSTEYPFVRFQIRGARAFFVRWTVGGDASPVSTVEVCAPAGGFFEATGHGSRRFVTRSPRFRELPPLRRYRLVASDSGWARGLLDRGAARLLDDLDDAFPGAPRVQVTAARFTVEIEAALGADDAARLRSIAERLLVLVRDPADSEGVEILATRFDPGAGRCPVCALPAEPPLLLCAACRIPHHRDCWTYSARCAIFGCGSKAAG